jgi:hypothetical protein
MNTRKNPNPQGKGLVPVLQGLQQHWDRMQVPPKQIDQISLELFTSLFVLQSQFKFTPVPGSQYWMYERDEEYRLMMVGPLEWNGALPGRCIGLCELQQDRTWTLALEPEVADDSRFMEEIEVRRRKLEALLEKAETVEDVLPACEAGLGFQSRVLAFILGRSLLVSMQLSGINALSYSEAKGLLSHEKPGHQ